MIRVRPAKTVDDYLKLPEGTRAELIEGEILMSPSPRERHQAVVGNLYVLLRTFVTSRKVGRVYTAPFDVHLPSGDVVEPDLVFVSTQNQSIIQDWVRGAPDLLAEVVSPDSPERDRIVKRHLYERNGVREYWIVDPAERSIEVLKLATREFASHGYFEHEDMVTSALLEGLAIPAGEIFA